jgi:hypothetical protein
MTSDAPLLVVYAWPKPFTDPHIATIQRNGIRSWLLLKPKPEVILFGNDPGIAEAARELGVMHVPEGPPIIEGVPRVRDLAAMTEQLSQAPYLCFINADIILTQSIMDGLTSASAASKHFLLGGSPWNTDVPELLDFRPGWEEDLRRRALAANDLRPRQAADFMLHPRGFMATAPEVLAGRWYVDNGLMWFTRHSGGALIDATSGIFTVHQSHGYGHLGQFEKSHESSGGAQWNLRAIGGRRHLFTWSNATHHYSRSGVKPYLAGKLMFWPTHPSFETQRNIVRFIARSTRWLRGWMGMRNPRET